MRAYTGHEETGGRADAFPEYLRSELYAAGRPVRFDAQPDVGALMSDYAEHVMQHRDPGAYAHWCGAKALEAQEVASKAASMQLLGGEDDEWDLVHGGVSVPSVEPTPSVAAPAQPVQLQHTTGSTPTNNETHGWRMLASHFALDCHKVLQQHGHLLVGAPMSVDAGSHHDQRYIAQQHAVQMLRKLQAQAPSP